MKKTRATTLYEHLLQEAMGWLTYPTIRQRRTQGVAEGMELVDKGLEWMVEQYTTFFTSTTGPSDLKPELLDAIYCRGLLRAVPEMIERTRSLSSLAFEGIPDEACLVYLKEAVKCYLYGLSQASIALTRAAVETALIQRAPTIPGKNLFEKINNYAEKANLPPQWSERAHNVRLAANDVGSCVTTVLSVISCRYDRFPDCRTVG